MKTIIRLLPLLLLLNVTSLIAGVTFPVQPSATNQVVPKGKASISIKKIKKEKKVLKATNTRYKTKLGNHSNRLDHVKHGKRNKDWHDLTRVILLVLGLLLLWLILSVLFIVGLILGWTLWLVIPLGVIAGGLFLIYIIARIISKRNQ